ncbi:hypothetical protein D9M70_334050 [compost metagenome]
MAAGFATGLLGEDLALHHVFAKQHHQPLGRAHELFTAGSPAHALGDRQGSQGGFDDAGQQANGGLAGNGLAEFQFRTALVDLLQVDAAFAGKAQGRLGRLAFGVEGGLDRRAVEVHAAVGLLGSELLDQDRQAARGGEDLGLGVAQAGGLEALFDAAEEGVTKGFQGFRRQLFGAQLYQKILCTHS